PTPVELVGPRPRLPGVFAGSLPDSWGRLVLDRAAGTSVRSDLDRLAFVGDRAMGALVYRPVTGGPDEAAVVKLGQLAKRAAQVIDGPVADLPATLTRAAGSAGGARPKFVVALRGDAFHIGPPPDDAEHWLVKLAGPTDPSDTPAVESAYLAMASAAGIDVPAHRLFRTGNTRALGTQRFDRIGTGPDADRVHTLTFADLYDLGPTEATLGRISYAQLLKATRRLAGASAVEQMFRRLCFNAIAHNRDDHVRNHAFTCGPTGLCSLAPAYDLTHATGPGGYHSIEVGPQRDPTRDDLLRIADEAGVAEPQVHLAAVAEAVGDWPKHAKAAGVSIRRTRAIAKDHRPNLAGS
ncbi:MAG: type II toxin-antitoxin system HipA family toxin, partial [Planctomycetota bacterium]